MQVTPEKKEPVPSEAADKPGMDRRTDGPVQPAPETRWRPIVAVLLSLVFAGLGHLYLKRYGRGGLLLFLALFLFRTSGYSPRAMMLNVILFVFSAFDAFSFAKRGYGIM